MKAISLLFVLSIFNYMNCMAQSAKKDKYEKETFPVSKTDAEWKAQLSDMEYYVLRQKGTERAFTGKYDTTFEPGSYVCAACGALLYKSNDKYDSHCGWPSFDKAVGKVGYRPDNSHGMRRIEAYCLNCGSHLGHVFDDGPRETTGKRHCINSVSIRFIPAAGSTHKK